MPEQISITPALNFLITKSADLTIRQLAVLMDCAGEPQTIRGVAAKRGLSKPAVTRAADKLTKQGFLVRKTDPKDRRSVFMSLTSQGKRFARNFA